MKSEKRDKKKYFYWMVAVLVIVGMLVGCYPSNLNWHSLKFWQTAKQGQAMDDKAVARFLSQIRVRPGNPDAHYNLASYYQERGLYREAIAEYDKVVRIDPNYIKAYNGKGICHDQIGEHDEAIACFKRAVTLDGTLEYVWNNLCYSYYLKGNYQEAVTACEQAVSINSGNIRIRNNLAMVLAMSGQYERAFKEFTVAGGGDKTYAHLKMAAIYHDKAMFTKAYEHYQSAQTLTPDSETARKGIIASREMLKIAEAASKQSDSAKEQAETTNLPTAAQAAVKSRSNVLDEKKAAEEYVFAQKLFEKGAFTEAAQHFEQSLTYNPSLKSANKGMAAAEALAKIDAAPSTKSLAAGKGQNGYRDKTSYAFERVGIEISNGNGKRHMARDVGKYLRKSGFNVVSLSNARHFKHESGSIIYEKDYKNVAEAISASIPQLTDMKEINKSPRSNIKVKVVIGKDLVSSREQYRN